MQIVLTQGLHAQVDEADYGWLNLFKWYAEKHKNTFYARTTIGSRFVRMHEFIMDTPDGLDTDHRNHNGLNNHRDNLRVCTRAENCQNARKRKGSSRYKGVSLYRPTGKWMACIRVDGRSKFLGYYEDEDYAAQVYNAAAERLFGKFAYLNVITKKGETGRLF